MLQHRLTRVAGSLAACVVLCLAVAGPANATTQPGGGSTSYGCRSQYACLYTDHTEVLSASHPHTDYKYYGYDNFSNVTGYHWINNNQTGGAKVYLCTGYGGTGCGQTSWTFGNRRLNYIPAGWALDSNLTPINSIKLTP